MNHQPRKRFGQNFLVDEGILTRILNTIDPAPDDLVVEIGPGQGALTQPLRARLDHLQVIEIDRDLAEALRARQDPGLEVIEQDALRVDYTALCPAGRKLRVVGNLPYNISTPLLFHLLRHLGAICDLHFLLQREVVDRMAAAPGVGDYGRLSVMMQVHCVVESLFIVPPEAFRPRPRVQSRIVRLKPLNPPLQVDDPAVLERMVREAFGKRRKTLRNALRGLVDAAGIEAAGLTPDRRPGEVSVAQWVALANAAAGNAAS